MAATVGRTSLTALIATALLAGCGSGGATTTRHATRTPTITEDVPTPVPPGGPAPASSIDVIRAWSDALRHGEVARAARYFALPSVMINGLAPNGATLLTAIHTRAQARAANASLPCGAKLITADQRGRFVNALFRLTNRPGRGGGCGSGTGLTARTNFVIAHGHIVQWIRAPDEPGDNPGPSPPPAPTTPPPSAAPAAPVA